MANWSDPRSNASLRATSVGTDAAAFDAGLRSYMLSVYNYMASGVLLTGIVALLFANSGMAVAVLSGPLRWLVMLAPLAFVMVLSFGINRLSTGAAQAIYWAYAAVMGLSMASIFLVFTGTSIAQTFFATALESGADGIAVAPLHGERWVTPIQQAVDQGVPVVGFNVTALDSALRTWVGQDDYASGVTLGRELIRQLDAAGATTGTIAVGSCNPGENVLQDRDAGLRETFSGAGFSLLATQDVHLAIAENARAWERVVTSHPEIVAAVGLCYPDVPNLAALKTRTGGTWLIGGYNLDGPSLDALASGEAQVVIGQQEYLQGYLPVAILAEHLINGTPLVEGWLETPAEVVTSENVTQYAARESDGQAQYDYYRAYIDDHFGDLQAAARPYDDLRTLGVPPATPAP